MQAWEETARSVKADRSAHGAVMEAALAHPLALDSPAAVPAAYLAVTEEMVRHLDLPPDERPSAIQVSEPKPPAPAARKKKSPKPPPEQKDSA